VGFFPSNQARIIRHRVLRLKWQDATETDGVQPVETLKHGGIAIQPLKAIG
jgi:hypothetical protein